MSVLCISEVNQTSSLGRVAILLLVHWE